MRISMLWLGIVAAAAVTACASSTGSGVDDGTTYQGYNDCIFTRAITDWRPLDNMNLVVFTGRRQAYHVQLTMRSTSLRFEDRLAFTDRDGRLCPYGGDSIVINGMMPDRIPIASIRRLTEAQLVDLYRSYGISVPEIIDTPVPAEQGDTAQ
ncbi:MAG TPA: DUF6491 family protein [Gammaproteobacteria bacterium]|nr:DUF6491 family protein [Gammaproteobacteria bacterium]